MDKNSLIGLLLIGAVIIGYTWYTAPTEAEIAQKAATADSLRAAQAEQIEAIGSSQNAEATKIVTEESPIIDTNDSLAVLLREQQNASRLGIFASAGNGNDDEETIIENEKFKVAFQSKGGQMKWLELKEYKTYNQEPLILFDERSNMNFIFGLSSGQLINTSDLYFSPASKAFQVSGEEENSFTMRLASNDPSKYLDLTYSISGDSYEIDLSLDMVGLQQEVDFRRNDLSMHWDMTGLLREKSQEREMERSSVFYRYKDDEREFLSEGKEDEEELEAKTNWIAFKQNFFSAVAIHPDGFLKDNSFISNEPADNEADASMRYLAEVTLPVEYKPNPHSSFKFYMGPNHYQTLSSYDNEMDRIIDLGWGIFGWMNQLLVIPIFNFLSKFISSYGVIILILTIIIKMILFPLTYKNYLSSAKMRVLKPEIDELNKKFEKEKDPMKKQQATMSLYRKSGVNPAAGCLPMIVQMPILYAMFRFFPASIELRQQSFLWADDLSSYDSIVNLPFDIPMYGAHISLFTVLMAVSTFLYTRMNSAQMPAAQPGMPNMQTIMYIFPFMMLFFFNKFASGLSYYYLLANLFSIGQMFIIKNVIIDEEKLRKKIKANQKKPAKKSNFQKRLEDAAKKRGYPTK